MCGQKLMQAYVLVCKPSFKFLYKPYIGYIVTLREYSKNVTVKGFRVWTQVFMTESQYLFVSAFSFLYLLHYYCLCYFTTWYQSFFDLGCCVLVFCRSHLVGYHLQQFLSQSLVHCLRQSHLRCQFFAFNNLVSVVGSSPSTISSRLSKHSNFSQSSRFIYFKLDLYNRVKFRYSSFGQVHQVPS